jgi:DNA-directed RNA polymerase specialized sigma24 family protein
MVELWGPLPPQEIELAPVDEMSQVERVTRLNEALESLPAEDRLVVQLFVMEDLAASDVARIVGLPNGKAVYNRVYRILADLREHFERIGMTKVDL